MNINYLHYFPFDNFENAIISKTYIQKQTPILLKKKNLEKLYNGIFNCQSI